MIFGWLCFIVGAYFGVMLLAYGLGFWFEGLGAGGSHFAAILCCMLICVMITATLLTMAERKWGGFFQDRTGPNRARLPGLPNAVLGGLPHIIGDVVKMLTKEAFSPERANKYLFKLAPMLAFAPVFALFAIVPAGPTLAMTAADGTVRQVMMVAANPDFGLLYIFGIASFAVYGTSLAGWSSNNKFALLGGVRASSQLISYEVALGLSLVGMMIAFSTVQLAGPTGMVESQGQYIWSTTFGSFDVGLQGWGIFLQPVGFLLFFAAAFAETKRAPFDAPEGESEIVGYFLEYSGMQFGLFMISEFVEVVVLGGVIVAIFFGGYHLGVGDLWLQNLAFMKAHPVLLGGLYGLVFWLKVVVLIYVQLVIRWSFPRFRYDQVQTLGWKILLPMGLINLFVTGALILWDPTLHTLALVGLLEIGVVIFLTVTPPRQVRREAEEAGHGHGHGGHDDHGHAAPALPSAGTH